MVLNKCAIERCDKTLLWIDRDFAIGNSLEKFCCFVLRKSKFAVFFEDTIRNEICCCVLLASKNGAVGRGEL